MTTQHDTTKRWRPRFSVRTLVVVVTLVCCYTACWGPTQTDGVAEVRRLAWNYTNNTSAVAPLVVRQDEIFWVEIRAGSVQGYDRRSYYFWFFGYTAKLPYERDGERMDGSYAQLIKAEYSPPGSSTESQ